ncbi:MAG: hypothetical protein NWE95_03485 [Candidatus Bathyarchaeota archaeon]|nr:hypothetical protein [Candidatus Bathyarchaeota archaeon]
MDTRRILALMLAILSLTSLVTLEFAFAQVNTHELGQPQFKRQVAQIWNATLQDTSTSGLVFSDGKIFAISSGHESFLNCIDALTGELVEF